MIHLGTAIHEVMTVREYWLWVFHRAHPAIRIGRPVVHKIIPGRVQGWV